MTGELITEADLAGLMKMDERRVADLRRREKWLHVKIGRAYRYTPEQVEHIIRSHTIGPASTPDDDRVSLIRAGLTPRSAARQAKKQKKP